MRAHVARLSQFRYLFFFKSGYYNNACVSEGDIIYDAAYARIRSRVVRFKYCD